MVDTSRVVRRESTDKVVALVGVYVAVSVLTVAALALLSARGSREATQDAWVHAVIVVVFAVVMPLRLRSARRGGDGAWRALGIIAGVLLVVNLVEALIPRLFPVWMRVEMIGIAALMAVIVVLALRANLAHRRLS